jgi:FKBP-type peptidyl-prolyl cis-trans isomerase FklB
MSKTIAVSLVTLSAGVILASALAQNSAPPKPQSSQTPAAASQQSPAAAKKPSSGAAKTTRPRSAQAPLTLKTEKDKVSYALGVNIGKSLHRDAVDLDPAIIARGLRDAITNGKTLLTDDEVRATLTAFQNEMRQKQQARMMELDQANKKAGQEFLEANKTKEGVIALPSGLQYKVLQQGTGPKPAPDDMVVCNYRGTLLDGTEFDSSYKRGQPATFPVNGVIKGWTEALQIMPVGSKWQLFIPSDLAYGDRGAGAQIGPGATLVFEVELLSIKSKEPAAAPPQPEAAQPQAQPRKPQL